MEGQILLWIQENLRFDWLNPIMRLITSLGNDSIFWIALTLVLVFFAKTRRAALGSALAMILTLIVVNIALKPIFARTRPYILLENLQILVARPGDHSFPSGHSAHALACSWVLFKSFKNAWGKAALVLGVLVALSRLYVGVHFPTDVLCGMLIGLLLAELAMLLLRRLPRGKISSKT